MKVLTSGPYIRAVASDWLVLLPPLRPLVLTQQVQAVLNATSGAAIGASLKTGLAVRSLAQVVAAGSKLIVGSL